MAYRYTPIQYNIYDTSLSFEENVKANAVIMLDHLKAMQDVIKKASAEFALGEITLVDCPQEARVALRLDEIAGNVYLDLAIPKGEKGNAGKSAYEIATLCGFEGTEAEWLASLKGEKGNAGKSAFEIAVENGYEGTIEEYTASLKGEKGDQGDSAYQVAVNNGFVGTEEEWLESLKGGANSAADLPIVEKLGDISKVSETDDILVAKVNELIDILAEAGIIEAQEPPATPPV